MPCRFLHINQKTEQFHDAVRIEVLGHLEAGLLQPVPAPSICLFQWLAPAVSQCVPSAASVSMRSGRLEELDLAEEYPLEENN